MDYARKRFGVVGPTRASVDSTAPNPRSAMCLGSGVRELPRRTKPLRGGKDRALSTGCRPQQLAPSSATPLLACTRAAPFYASAWLRSAAASAPLFTSRSSGTLPRTRPLPIYSIYIRNKSCARRGFVLRDCIRRADGACFETAFFCGPADTTFFRRQRRTAARGYLFACVMDSLRRPVPPRPGFHVK